MPLSDVGDEEAVLIMHLWGMGADAYGSMMDFFDSMAETVGGDPYGRYHSLYGRSEDNTL